MLDDLPAVTKSLPLLLLAVVTALSVLSEPLASARDLAAEYQINDHGHLRTFAIATDELQIVGKRHPEKIVPASNAESARQQAMTLGHAVLYSVQGSLIPELFGTRLRCTGASLGYQLAPPFAGGLAPLIAATLEKTLALATKLPACLPSSC